MKKSKVITQEENIGILSFLTDAQRLIGEVSKVLALKALDDTVVCSPQEVNTITRKIIRARYDLNIARIKIDLSFNKEAHAKAEAKWRKAFGIKETASQS